jgi:N-acetyl-anhydromuramyl-L-alanine amidase AmpD
MAKHRTRVGLHARNDYHFPEADYTLVRRARIETMKMMSFTDVSVYERLKTENPDIEFIVRLYDDRLRGNSRPGPADFAAKMIPVVNLLQPHATKFEIHNEPNHAEGIEAWGSSDQQARSFRSWYLQALPILKEACPWAKFGFPGLALNNPHRDLEWLDICQDAIVASDWLGCHCYWQYGNMMKQEWGLRFQLYHERFPNMPIEITEFGDSTPQRPRDEIADQYALYYKELNKYPYLGSACAFIASSPDPTWALFVWMKEGGEMLPVVDAVRNMKRTTVTIAVPEPAGEPATATKPVKEPTVRTFRETGKTVKGSFLKFFNQYGLDICGYPITEQIEEAGLPAQYFQRMALEEFQKGKIRLKLVGTEAWASRQKIEKLETYIKELRRYPISGVGPLQPIIEDIVDRLPTHEVHRYPSRELTDIGQIVIHHTATSPTITPQRLAEYQVRQLDKAGIAYHYVVGADGVIFQTNQLETVSDHAYRRSQESVGICFTGNFTSAIPTTAQLEAGAQLCAWLLARLRLSSDKIVGLGEFVNTQSPGKQWLQGERWKDKLLALVETALEAGGEDQSAIVESLREQIEALQAEVANLRQRPATGVSLGTASLQEVVDEIATLITSLQQQINTLKAENDRLLAEIEEAPTAIVQEKEARIASLTRQIAVLEQERDNALADLAAVETALQAKDAEQSSLITSLRNQIKSLESQVTQLKSRPTTPVVVSEPQPTPSGSKISMPPVQNMVDKLPRHGSKKYGSRPLSDIKTLVIHHSAVPASVGPKRIADYHVKSLDWPGIGYHFLVAADGVIYQGNEIKTVSFHAAKVNPRGLGICFLGSFQNSVPPAPQLQAGAHLVAWLLQYLDLDLEVVKGHQEYMQTACPGNQWLRDKKWKQQLRQAVVSVQQGGVLPGLEPSAVPGAKSIYHYMLFWHHGTSWALSDWVNAQDYIAAFQPTVGFASQDAVLAEYVTIVGGPLGVPKKVEDWLVANGCKVDRIAGSDEAATKAMLADLIKQRKRFRSFDG